MGFTTCAWISPVCGIATEFRREKISCSSAGRNCAQREWPTLQSLYVSLVDRVDRSNSGLFSLRTRRVAYPAYWHCPHSIAEQGQCNGTVSVCLSVPFARCSSMQWVCCCGLGGQEISIDCCTAGAAATRNRRTALSSNCR